MGEHIFRMARFMSVLILTISTHAMAELAPPQWPTKAETPPKNPCQECRCPEIMDDGKYAVEQILSPMRGYHYSELFLVCPGIDTAGIWNTTLHNHRAANSRDSIPEALFRNYSDKRAAEEYGAVSVWMEPTRVWTYDKMRVYRGTTARNFSGLDTAWGAYLPAAAIGAEVHTYEVVDVTRNSTSGLTLVNQFGCWTLLMATHTSTNRSPTRAAGMGVSKRSAIGLKIYPRVGLSAKWFLGTLL